MRNLIQFFVRNSPFFVFLLYGLISLFLLIRFNSYHQSVFFSSANSAIAEVYSVAGNVTSYFGLKQINQDLLERNGYLEKEILVLKEQLRDQRSGDLMNDSITKYDFIVAQVINNSATQLKNYITQIGRAHV